MSYDAFRTALPAAHTALLTLSKAITDTGFDQRLTEIVKIRVSQLNGCAFCVAYHLDRARRLGITEATLDLIAVWRDSPAFSERERAALAWAERLTMMAGPESSSSTEPPTALFDQAEILRLAVVIATINAWNRIAGGLHFPPSARAA
ncbi:MULTISPECIES: carboxymuconolactone decarboxylase family protein [unclassified Methylobacterium]|jgi:AhpD family alkylhydroperoxidase|uniref:carboxymuconolactone decarboxylase family protein n=1 Tax=unclassified Methylobacterium TaxID=2615210 RepID=UPI001352B96F|nr:carboxymuconolactone decarboxylase family protein [Methylobacterium sp. 2A]MWV23814.1 carboxymuconolactone decarboxylase family protein [Methylobacterium sp. 2A]